MFLALLNSKSLFENAAKLKTATTAVITAIIFLFLKNEKFIFIENYFFTTLKFILKTDRFLLFEMIVCLTAVNANRCF
jgi:hypothetical protein